MLLIKNNKLLLLRRKSTGWSDNLWAIPGGRVDGNESLKAAAIREAYEELNINIDIKSLYFVHLGHIKRDNFEYLLAAFFANKWQGQLYNKEEHKHSAIDWFDLNSLPENLAPYAQEVIDAYKQNLNYSEYGW